MELRIVRYTDRFDDACAFYATVLGWPVTREWPAAGEHGRGRIFGYGDVGRVELIEVRETGPVAGLFLSIEVDDVAALAGRLAAAGIALLRGLADQPWGHRNLAVLDPAGIELVFFQWVGTH
ncbi:MAG: VOC family protein [Actinomycetota bacterium]|nr:VOC family protein [Actinomycetota bacterium]